MRQVILTVGLQASGKSTWAKRWVTEAPNRKRLNRDELRGMLDAGQWSRSNESFVISVRNQMLIEALRAGNDVVIDDTNLRAKIFDEVCDLLRDHGIVAKVEEKPFPIEIEEAIRRDEQRYEHVGSDVIRKTAARYHERVKNLNQLCSRMALVGPKVPEFVPWDATWQDAILCDLDGTLAKIGDRSPYDASRCDELDSVNEPVANCVWAHRTFFGCKIVFVSARDEKDRAPTERFIRRACPHVHDWELLMRPTGDKRKDSVVKRELFDRHIRGKYNVLFVLDDRNQVVREWRAMGLTCFQVAEGAF